MKLLTLLALLLAGCATAPRQPARDIALETALQEQRILETMDRRVPHTCYSEPIYGIDGQYTRIFVRCF